MSQIKWTPVGIIVVLFGLMMFAACGSSTPNKNAGTTFDTETGSHATDWLPAKHKESAQAEINVCKECHGEELNGGIAGVTCTQCHIGGAESVHPLDWQDTSATPNGKVKHRWYVIQNGTVSCENQYCHGASLAGVTDSGNNCADCHTYKIPTVANCSTCHDFPQATNKHSQHIALQDVDCSVCHSGNHAYAGNSHSGSTTVLLKFLTTYTAKSGTTASFDAAANTCSKVSCHGGQTTPDWTSSAAFDVNSQCASCHAYGTAEYNSYNSGEHDYHVNSLKKACTNCHDTDKLAVNHFTTLSTSALEGPASATMKDALNYTNGSCTPACHETKSWGNGN